MLNVSGELQGRNPVTCEVGFVAAFIVRVGLALQSGGGTASPKIVHSVGVKLGLEATDPFRVSEDINV